MSILDTLKNLAVTTAENKRVEMTDFEVEQCKSAIRAKNRGMNVHPNRYDVKTPYRVAINFNKEWENFGNFTDDNVAAAIGTIISAGYFGDKARAGDFVKETAEASPEYQTWINDARNVDIISRANGVLPCMLAEQNGGSKQKAGNPAKHVNLDDNNPF